LIAFAVGEGMDSEEARSQTVIFADYYRGTGKVMADWMATWRNWVRRQMTTYRPARAPVAKGDRARQSHDALRQRIADEERATG